MGLHLASVANALCDRSMASLQCPRLGVRDLAFGVLRPH